MSTTYKYIYFRGVSLSNIEVRCGDWDLLNTLYKHGDLWFKHQDRKIQEVTIHPLYTGTVNDDFSDMMNYNFALLHLEKDFDFYPHISHVCLPEFPEIKTGKKH